MMRQPKPDRARHLGRGMAGAVGTCRRCSLLGYAIIPHEFITFADKYLNCDTDDVPVPDDQFTGRSPIDLHATVLVDIGRRRSSTCIFFGLNLVAVRAAGRSAARTGRGELPRPPSRAPAAAARLRGAACASAYGRPVTTAGEPDGHAPTRTRRCRSSSTDYVLQEVDPTCLTAGGQAEAVPPHRPGRVHPLRGLRRHLPVEVHPHGVGRRDRRGRQHRAARRRPRDHVAFIVDEDVCTRCALCVDRCPTGVIILGKLAPTSGATATRTRRTNRHGYAYGVRF